MGNSNLDEQLDLIENISILMLIEHQGNKTVLNQFLTEYYNIITSLSRSLDQNSFDMIIVDEESIKKKHRFIKKIKKVDTSFYLPVILISKHDIKNIKDKYLKLVDEIVDMPISKRLLKSRIENLLSIRKLFLSSSIYQKLTEENPVGICILKEDRIKYVNNSFLKIIENKKEKVMNEKIFDIFSADKLEARIIEKNPDPADFISLKLQKNDKNKWVNIKIREMKHKKTSFKLLIMVDVTKQQKSEEKIKFLSFHDKLTELYNRNYFMEELKRLNTKRQLPLTIIMGDVNSLKIVNDAFGHEKGDQLLKKVAEILNDNIREADILARIGGDEFSILLPRTDKETASKICKRIKNACRDSEMNLIEISIALGTATKQKVTEDINQIFKRADDKMYQKKIKESEKVKKSLIKKLKANLYKVSQETKEHNKRMKKMALKLAERINLPPEEKRKLKLTVEYHDIGKVTVAGDILKKDDKLTEEEYELVKTHSEASYRIVKTIPELSVIAKSVLYHHERWDGSGYPQGLQKKEIPLNSRITAIVDAYDVMTGGRSYKKKLSKEKALAEIIECGGSQFDPELVKEFEQVVFVNF